jgi:hypothetical protein
MPTKLTTEILTAAIDGLEIQKKRIDAQIAEIRQMLDGGSKPAAAPSQLPALKRRKISKAGRAAIAAAQRKRWAESKKQAAPAAPKPKRKLSAAGRRAIIAATKKRWAAKRAEAAKQTSA